MTRRPLLALLGALVASTPAEAAPVRRRQLRFRIENVEEVRASLATIHQDASSSLSSLADRATSATVESSRPAAPVVSSEASASAASNRSFVSSALNTPLSLSSPINNPLSVDSACICSGSTASAVSRSIPLLHAGLDSRMVNAPAQVGNDLTMGT